MTESTHPARRVRAVAVSRHIFPQRSRLEQEENEDAARHPPFRAPYEAILVQSHSHTMIGLPSVPTGLFVPLMVP